MALRPELEAEKKMCADVRLLFVWRADKQHQLQVTGNKKVKTAADKEKSPTFMPRLKKLELRSWKAARIPKKVPSKRA